MHKTVQLLEYEMHKTVPLLEYKMHKTVPLLEYEMHKTVPLLEYEMTLSVLLRCRLGPVCCCRGLKHTNYNSVHQLNSVQ